MEPISTTVGTIKTAVDLLKSLRGMARNIKNAELNEKLMDLQTVMLDLQGKLSELQAENEAMKTENDRVKKQLAVKEILVFDHNSGQYWTKDEGHGREGPFCQRCYEADGKAIRLRPSATFVGGFFCQECIMQKAHKANG